MESEEDGHRFAHTPPFVISHINAKEIRTEIMQTFGRMGMRGYWKVETKSIKF